MQEILHAIIENVELHIDLVSGNDTNNHWTHSFQPEWVAGKKTHNHWNRSFWCDLVAGNDMYNHWKSSFWSDLVAKTIGNSLFHIIG